MEQQDIYIFLSLSLSSTHPAWPDCSAGSRAAARRSPLATDTDTSYLQLQLSMQLPQRSYIRAVYIYIYIYSQRHLQIFVCLIWAKQTTGQNRKSSLIAWHKSDKINTSTEFDLFICRIL